MIDFPATARGRFTGVSRIVAFNWPKYAVGVACIILALAAITVIATPELLRWTIVAGIAAAAWWLIASLLASRWIYDLSPLTDWQWTADLIPLSTRRERKILNVHSGYDDTSTLLRRVFSVDTVSVLDVFDADRMTETSIHRARRAHPPRPDTLHGTANGWPVKDHSIDCALFLMSAHEFRTPSEREALFAEARRVLAPRGRILLVEHLRDFWNFAAFGPGFRHFWPRSEWLRLASSASLRVVNEGRITPFVGYFVLEKQP